MLNKYTSKFESTNTNDLCKSYETFVSTFWKVNVYWEIQESETFTMTKRNTCMQLFFHQEQLQFISDTKYEDRGVKWWVDEGQSTQLRAIKESCLWMIKSVRNLKTKIRLYIYEMGKPNPYLNQTDDGKFVDKLESHIQDTDDSLSWKTSRLMSVLSLLIE